MAKASKVKLYVCKTNLRPRIDGIPVLIEAGKPFDGSLIDKDSLGQMLKAGSVIQHETEAGTEQPEVQKKSAKNKPTGIWDFKREDMEQLDIVTLNALYKERAEANGIEAKLIENKDELLNILCSEA